MDQWNRIEIPEELTYTFFDKGVKIIYWEVILLLTNDTETTGC